MKPNDIFEKALGKVNEAYLNQNRLKWGVSVCATPIQIGKGMILGINWGGGGISDENSYESQLSMPTIPKFQDDLQRGGYKFLQRSKKYLENYLKIKVASGEFNYTNLCLFRSPQQKYLRIEDYEACFETFKFLVEEIAPPWIISLGTTNIEKIEALESTFTYKLESFGRASGYKGICLNTTFYCLPHPNFPLYNTDRDGIWNDIFSN